MRKVSLYLLLLRLAGCAPEPRATPPLPTEPIVQQAYQPIEGVLRIGPEPDRAVPLTETGYTLLLPGNETPPEGVVAFLDARRVDAAIHTAPGTFDHEALARNVATLHLTTGNPLDFFFDEVTMAGVAERLQAIPDENGLRQAPLFFAGLSLGETRALKLTIFLTRHADPFWASPHAVAIVDAPLDTVRFWEAEQQAAHVAFHPAAADEGRWVSYLLETNLGGPPTEQFDRYV